jgi:hypothetical protein
MTPTIEQIEEQIARLQQTLNQLKTPKLEVSRNFTGQYFAPYQERLYRRMESDGVPIWESYSDMEKKWVVVTSKELMNLEKTYLKDCVSDTKESLEEFME